jgi:hypothetical protein
LKANIPKSLHGPNVPVPGRPINGRSVGSDTSVNICTAEAQSCAV